MQARFWIILITICMQGQYVFANKADSLSIAAYSKNNFDSALITFKLAEKAIKNDTQYAFYNFYKYFYFKKLEIDDSAKNYVYIALKSLKNVGIYDGYHQVNNSLFWRKVNISEYDSALLLAKKSLSIAIKYKDTATQIDCFKKIGIVYHDWARYKEGVNFSQKAYKLALKFKNSDLIAETLNAIAINYDDWNKPDSAIFFHRKVLALENVSDFNFTQTLNNIGNTFLKIGKLDSAQKYIYQSYLIDKALKDDYKLATSMNNLGLISLKKNKLKLAKLLLDSALFYSNLSGSIEKKRDVNHSLFEYYLEIKQFNNAITHLAAYHTYKDSMLDVNRMNVIAQLENKAKDVEHSRQITLKQASIEKAENKTKVRNFWIALISALLLISLLIIRQVYLKRIQVAKDAEIDMQNERLRISRDLHDNLGAELTYISSIIDQKTYNLKDVEAKKEWEQISQSSRFAMEQMRETIWAIKTQDINFEVFGQKIKQITEKYASANQIQLTVSASGFNYKVNPTKVINLLRICQESIINAIKYSACKHITVDLNAEEGNYKIQVIDDGNGFEIQSVQKGYGLQNMQERADEIGATLEILSEKGKGTKIIIIGKV